MDLFDLYNLWPEYLILLFSYECCLLLENGLQT